MDGDGGRRQENDMIWQWIVILAGAVLIAAAASAGMWIYMRRKYVRFTEEVCRSIDDILERKDPEEMDTEGESLASRTAMRLKRLHEITAASARESERQKEEVQSVVSDISHQLKTPIANVVMYCDTAMNPQLTDEEKERCMHILKGQVSRLDFLVQTLIRMSRLEHNIIRLHPQKTSLKRLMEEAAEVIRAKAAEKELAVEVCCPDELVLLCDEKWTIEALTNVLDNAVKYSPRGGRIRLCSERMEIYTKICVTDNGMGILPEHINDVCRRFYREERAAKTEGLGIGLYLTREILDREKGYLKIASEENAGTTVSLYLLNFR